MTIQQSELQQLADSLHSEHGSIAIAAASLISLSRRLFRHHGRARKINLEALVTLQIRCVHEWAARRHTTREQVARAVDSLMQAGSTADILDMLHEASDMVPSTPHVSAAGPPADASPQGLTFDAMCVREHAAAEIENALLLLNGITCVRYMPNGLLVPRGGPHSKGTAAAPESTLVIV